MERVPSKAGPATRMDLPSSRETGGQSGSDDDQIHSHRGNEVTSDSAPTPTQILFIDDVAVLLRVSRSTIERRRREGTFPIPELPGLDCRPRWSRVAVERFLAASNGRIPKRRLESRRYR
jgi:predicted DNA-binding transcriptional regulator AlpA